MSRPAISVRQADRFLPIDDHPLAGSQAVLEPIGDRHGSSKVIAWLINMIASPLLFHWRAILRHAIRHLWIAAALCIFQWPHLYGAEITPIKCLQVKLDSCVTHYIEARDSEGDQAGVSWLRSVRELERMSVEVLIPQVAYYFGECDDSRKRAALTEVVFHFIKPSQADVISSLAPLIDASDQKVNKWIYEILAYYVDGERSGCAPDFRLYTGVLRRSKDNPPLGLVEYMYIRNPGAALMVVDASVGEMSEQREHLTKNLWASQVIHEWAWRAEKGFRDEATRSKPDAIAQVLEMSKSDRWAARLFAATVMLKNPELRVLSAIRQLKNDEHYLVRKFASEASDPAASR